ncbi:MAG: four helix bundle protein [Planctomycetaceae bacterium]
MFKHERLEVWQEAIQFVCDIYLQTRTFPSEERFGLTNQVRRSSNSVAANIAEGCSRSSDKEYIRYLEISYASLAETVSHLEVALRLNFLSPEDHLSLRQPAERIGRMLSGLRTSLERSLSGSRL